ncbi:Enzymatic polyprotein [Trichinella papuae]|uniref:Enzymatic polyprotein n=2 Tax=Trichinella TaxID=6333 RepID=A0A0V1LZ81_9BILA|nr:Enzymatic polyprotein [Trichinella pseudospiralis]KRZ64790.1 Enzymatic polyprotein [Trichinella papuae]
MLLDLGIIWPSISSWALWLHMTVSNQRNLGAAVEATDVSTVSQSQILKILNLNHFVTQNRDQKRFSKFNLICIYQQILLAVEDISKTVITAPFRLCEYFGLRNAVQTFQSYMAEVARGYQFCFVYLDDALAAGHHQNHFTMLYY